MTALFRTDLRDRLPLPLARLYRRAHNATSWLERHSNALYLLEATVKLTAAAQIAAYLASGERMKQVDRRLTHLALPSLGHWVEFLREVSRATAALDPHPFPDVAGTSTLIREKHEDLPAVRRALLEMGERVNGVAPFSANTVRVLDLLDRLPSYRNQVLGHGALREDDFYEALGDVLLDAAVEWLNRVPPLGGAVLEYVAEVREAPSGERLAEVWDLTGPDAMRASAPGGESLPPDVELHPGRLYLRKGDHRLDLHPLVVCQPAPPDAGVLFLNRSQVDRKVEYLDYVTGETSSAPHLLADHLSILGRVLGSTVSPEKLERLQAKSLEADATTEAEAPEDEVRRFGDFDLLETLGAGGMGTVYLARQRSLNRLVALKLLPPALSTDEVAAARFRREIQAMARADHRNVVRILQSGRTEGTYWFAMEYVEGADLREVAATLSPGADRSTLAEGDLVQAVSTISDTHRAAVAAAPRSGAASRDVPDLGRGRSYYHRLAEVFRDAARGLQHLHERGVLHRDVKPGNVMLTRDEGRAVVMDLGLARLTGEASMTGPSTLLGTIQYAAPEQLQAGLLAVDARSDVYGLGATLYELSTGRPPFEADSLERLIAKVLRYEAPPPRRVDRGVPADVDAIVRKAMDRNPDRRYPSMAAFSDDLDHFARGEPVSARPPGLGTLTRMWVRRHAPIVFTAAAALVVIVVGTILFMRSLGEQRDRAEGSRVQAERDRDRALAAETRATESEARVVDQLVSGYVWRATATSSPVTRLLYAGRAVDVRDRPDARGHLLQAAGRVRASVWATRRSIEGQLSAAYSPDGTLLATSGDAARLWDVATGALRAEMSGGPGITVDVAFDPSGQRLACADHDGAVRVWDCAHPERAPLAIPWAHEGPARKVAFLGDGSRLVSAGLDGTIVLWSLAGPGGLQKEVRRWEHAHERAIWTLATSPDGRWIVSGCNEPRLLVWSPDEDQPVARLEGHAASLRLAAFDAAGGRLVTLDRQGGVRRWATGSWELDATFAVLGPDVYSAATTVGADALVTGHEDGTVVITSLAPGGRTERVEAHGFPVSALAVAPDARSLASGSADELSLRLWSLERPELLAELQGHGRAVVSVAARDGLPFVASAGNDGLLHLWDPATGRPAGVRRSTLDPLLGLAAHPTLPLVLSGDQAGALHVWNLEDGTQRELGRRAGNAFGVAYDDTGSRVASCGTGGTVELWVVADDGTSRLDRSLPTSGEELYSVAFGPGQTPHVAAGGRDGIVYVWDLAEDTPTPRRLVGHDDEIGCVAFDPRGEQLASAASDRTVRIWDVSTGSETERLEGHTKDVAAVRYAPDGSRLVSGGWDRTIRVWDTGSWTEVAALEGHSDAVWGLAFLRGGEQLVSGSRDGTLRLWELADLPTPDRLRGHQGRVSTVAVAPDGATLASSGDDATIRLWDARTGRALRVLVAETLRDLPLDERPSVNEVFFVDEGRRLVSVGADHAVRVWDVATGSPVATHGPIPAFFWSAASLPDARAVAVATEFGVYVVDLESGVLLKTFGAGPGDVIRVAAAPDGKRVATARMGDSAATIWDATTGDEVARLDGHGSDVWALAWDATGERIATASLDGTVRVWDSRHGRVDATLEGHTRPAICVAFDPSGRYVASGSSDRTVRLWDLATGREAARFDLGGEQADAVVFHPDGSTLYAAGAGGSVHVVSLRALLWPAGDCLERGQRATGFRLDGPFDVVPPPPSSLELVRR